MSGADRTPEQIANEIHHILMPECPAFPGMPNPCETEFCDCFGADQLPERVKAMLEELQRLTGKDWTWK